MRQHIVMTVLVVLLISGCTPTSAPTETSAPVEPTTEQTTAPIQEETPEMSAETASSELKQAVLKAVSTQKNVSVDQLEIVSEEAADWPDACLGLGGPDEMCAMMLTPGWGFEVSDGEQTWQYRTDLDASQVRLADS